jgi:hypothetical protein
MSLKIDRLDISIAGTPSEARRFARALKTELARIEVAPGVSAKTARVEAPSLATRPGESPSVLARRVARAVAAAANSGEGGE